MITYAPGDNRIIRKGSDLSGYFVLNIQYVNRPPEQRNIAAPVTTIGRESGDIVLNDPQTSSRHAEIHFRNGQVAVRDTGSTNGTWFNGQRVTEFGLSPGQMFHCGQTTLQLLHVQAAPAQGPMGTVVAMAAPAGLAGYGAPAAQAPQPPQAWNQHPAQAPAAPQAWGSAPQAAYSPQHPQQQHAAYAAPQAQQVPGYAAPHAQQPQAAYAPQHPQQQHAAYAAPQAQQVPGYAAPHAQQPQAAYAPQHPQQPQAAYSPQHPQQPQQAAYSPQHPQQPQQAAYSPQHPQQQHAAYGAPAPQQHQQPPAYGGQQPGEPQYAGYAAPGQQPAYGGQQEAQQSGWAAPPAGGSPPDAQPLAIDPSGGVRTNFDGKGGDLFVTLLVGGLLSLVTLGIYLPWFLCKLASFVLSNTRVGPTRHGDLRFAFTGKGGELIVTMLVGGLLTLVTLGIYLPWFLCNQIRFFTANVAVTADDGTQYRLRFDGQGAELLVPVLVGYLLTYVTLGIYGPWFLCKLQKAIYGRTVLLENEEPVGAFDFEGKGGELLVTMLVGTLLSIVTLGIYMPWFQVKLFRFMAAATRVNYRGRTFAGEFQGTGGEYFVTFLVGILLTIVTLYVYLPWFMIKQWKFQWNHRVFRAIGSAAPAPPE